MPDEDINSTFSPPPGRPRSVGLGLLALSLLVACDRAPCAGLHRPSQHPLAPHIVSADVLKQDNLDPYSFIVELLFLAPHGDVSDGSLDLYVGSSSPVSLPLKPYFGPANVEPDAVSGRLAIPLHFADSALQDDSLVRLGLQMQDGSQFYSNCLTLELHVLVDKLGAIEGLKTRTASAHCRLAATEPAAAKATLRPWAWRPARGNHGLI